MVWDVIRTTVGGPSSICPLSSACGQPPPPRTAPLNLGPRDLDLAALLGRDARAQQHRRPVLAPITGSMAVSGSTQGVATSLPPFHLHSDMTVHSPRSDDARLSAPRKRSDSAIRQRVYCLLSTQVRGCILQMPTPRGPLRRRRRDNPSDRTTNLKKKHLHLRYVCIIQTQGDGFDLPA
ncbi:hypothetical protein OH76DRAFT_689820 [Lentinus brumalis]|uniref:Uncharacterized protein n=1 Tax=Lentinus brumalis TaxID=2498619 RepID=A0A371D654_9APHY|nr:hypothetical protein OH76DRAFT_689820 [Polyporus brumalis]